MATSSLVHSASAPDGSNVNNPVRPEKLTKPAAATAIQRKPAKKMRNRIPPIQRLRVMEKYALGRNQTAIAAFEEYVIPINGDTTVADGNTVIPRGLIVPNDFAGTRVHCPDVIRHGEI